MTDPSREPAGTPGTTGAPASAGPSGSSGSNGSGGSTRRPALQPVDVLRQMPLRRRAAQVVMPRVAGAFLPDGSAEHELLAHWVADLGVGGVLVGMGPPLEIAARLNTLQSLAAVPLLSAGEPPEYGVVLYRDADGEVKVWTAWQYEEPWTAEYALDVLEHRATGYERQARQSREFVALELQAMRRSRMLGSSASITPFSTSQPNRPTPRKMIGRLASSPMPKKL